MAKKGSLHKWAQQSLSPHTCFVWALGMTVCCFVATLLLLGVRYQLNDDAIISNIAAGAYGAQTHFLVYVNVLLGWVLKPFYALLGSLNWFVFFQVGGGILCFALLGSCVLKQWGKIAGSGLFAAFLVAVGVDFFHKFHYVKYAALYLVTGLLLVALHLGQKNAATVGGLLLALVGSMLRFQMFVAVGGLAAALLLIKFFRLDALQKRRAAAVIASLLVLVLGAKSVDILTYRLNSEWASYAQFNRLRTEISDYKLQFGTPETLAPLGYTVTDYEMLKTWNFYDPTVFDRQALQDIVDALPGNTWQASVRQAGKTVWGMFSLRPAGFALGAVLLGWFLFSDKKCWSALAGMGLVLVLEVLFLCWRGRFPDTIGSSLTLAALVFCAACYGEIKHKKPKWALLCSCLLLLASIPFFKEARAASRLYWQDTASRYTEYEAAVADKNILYLADAQLVDTANGYNVWRPQPKGYFSNIVFTGSWLMHSPFQQRVLQQYGMENLYRDSLNREDAMYLETVYAPLKVDYLQQHYNPAALLLEVESGVVFTKYRVVAS